jgi:hypothetical protein
MNITLIKYLFYFEFFQHIKQSNSHPIYPRYLFQHSIDSFPSDMEIEVLRTKEVNQSILGLISSQNTCTARLASKKGKHNT